MRLLRSVRRVDGSSLGMIAQGRSFCIGLNLIMREFFALTGLLGFGGLGRLSGVGLVRQASQKVATET